MRNDALIKCNKYYSVGLPKVHMYVHGKKRALFFQSLTTKIESFAFLCFFPHVVMLTTG